ncbi:MAG: ABC transporter substrate-binding protein [Chloroflexi bacterium]|nr:ABC transporter substrate-binding protein [Chloroflexota bacterium]
MPTLARNGDRGTEGTREGEKTRLPLSFSLSLILSFSLSLLLAACTASTPPVVKIGLVAPFEGRYRHVGYEAIYAARLAIREINARGGIDGQRIELVALDDRGEPEQAITAARQLVLDPQVVAVIGHLRPDSSDAAMKVYCEAGLPVIVVESAAQACEGAFVLGRAPRDRWPDDQLIFVSSVPDPGSLSAAQDFVKSYNAIPIDGTRAGPIALQTYDALNLLFEAIARTEGIDREGVQAALSQINFSGLGAPYAFDSQGQLIDPQTYVFEYVRDQQQQLIP